MSSTNTSPRHFVLFLLPIFGHLRPLCTLATRLVLEQENIIVTLVVRPEVLDRAKTEVSHQFLNIPSESSKVLQRIRILSPSLTDLNSVKGNTLSYAGDAYPATYRTLYQAEPITCSTTGTTFSAVPTPCAVILDDLNLPQFHALRAVSGHSVPIISSTVSGAGSLIHVYGPESMGGEGDTIVKIDPKAASAGPSIDEIGDKICIQTEAKLVQVPGLPAMYDYEFHPQRVPPVEPNELTRRGYTSLQECDAIIVVTSYIFDSVSLDALKHWVSSSLHKKLHVVGPLLPPGYGSDNQNTAEVSNDIEAFLNEMLVQHGKQSVFFVSFGSFCWPTVSEYVDELIEALVEKKAPFILASRRVSEQQKETIKSSGLGMSTEWSSQQFILNHPATGWFVTHAGFNSVNESLGSGIPLICWPFFADQPAAAVHMSENLNVAFELFQVRIGDGLKTLHRNGITPAGTREAVGIELRQTIDLCRSEKGQKMRCHAQEFKIKYAKAWEEGGIARQQIRDLLDNYV